MKNNFFREVSIFDGVRNQGDGELLFSFKAPPVGCQNDEHHEVLILDVREHNTICVTATTYKVSCLHDGKNVKLVVERNNKEPLVFMKPSPRSNWFLIDSEDQKLISYAGCHSLNMLVSEFKARALAQEH